MEQLLEKLLNNGVAIAILAGLFLVIWKLIFSPPKAWMDRWDNQTQARLEEAASRSKQAESLISVAKAIDASTAAQTRVLDVVQELAVSQREEMKQLRLLVRTVVDRNERQDSEIQEIKQRTGEYASPKH